MRRMTLVMCSLLAAARAIAGSAESNTGVIDVQQPNLQSVQVLDSSSIQVSFSEPMYVVSAQDPGEYVISGTGAGTFSANPDSVTGTGPFVLAWNSGEMTIGAALVITAAGLEDAAGNPITIFHTGTSNGVGAPPDFTNVAASPSPASAGTVVTITFDVSELLLTVPSVTVNGNAATYVAGPPYEFDYTVQNSDPLGPASIQISGLDLASNAGAATDTTALNIEAAELPVPTASPWAMAALAGCITLLFVRRHHKCMVAILLLFTPAVWADTPPVVSNVSFLQQRNGSGTEVVITYDLTADTPCNITVELSKDGGTDGYIYPVDSLSGTRMGVTAGTGRQLVWSVGADYAGEYIAQARLRVTADPQVLPEMVDVAGGTFTMGDVWGGGDSDESPTHSVTLSAYKIGKFEISNQQYALALNWANAQGYLTTATASSVVAYGQQMIFINDSASQVGFDGTNFFVETRDSQSQEDHPLVNVSWYGAAAFCNWISEMAGLTPCYNTTTWACTFSNGGYFLPTEAQWEFAASYDPTTPGPTSSRWKYGNSSDTPSSSDINYLSLNPYAFTSHPYTTEAGDYTPSASPVGAFDMSGNVSEFINDWTAAYSSSAVTNPTGPGSGAFRGVRGGAYIHGDFAIRTCDRVGYVPGGGDFFVGFRVAQQ